MFELMQKNLDFQTDGEYRKFEFDDKKKDNFIFRLCQQIQRTESLTEFASLVSSEQNKIWFENGAYAIIVK